MHREQNFLSRSWKAYLSLIEESPRLAGGITCQEQTNGSQAARWRLFQGRRAGLPHRSKHHGRVRGVATLRDRCKDRRGEDARALGPARVTPTASRDSVCILTATASSRPSPSGRTTSGCSKASIRCRGRRGGTVCCGASTPRRAQGLGKTNYRMRRHSGPIFF